MTQSNDEIQSHIIDLEIKISHQDVAIEELKTALFEQHSALDKLQKDLKRLTDRLESVDGGPLIGPGNDKPPHY